MSRLNPENTAPLVLNSTSSLSPIDYCGFEDVLPSSAQSPADWHPAATPEDPTSTVCGICPGSPARYFIPF